jgi:hypothetical protein
MKNDSAMMANRCERAKQAAAGSGGLNLKAQEVNIYVSVDRRVKPFY